jgi:ATP-dependent DNA helicase UvrD/PcrA
LTFTPSAAQQRYFNWIVDDFGNAVLVAVAGAGKTTTILKGIELMDGRVFVGAYNADMAKELKSRVANLGRRDVFAGTFHSAGFKQLRFSFSKRFALETDGRKVTNIAEKFVQDRPDLEPYMGAAVAVVSMAKQRGIGAIAEAGNANDNNVWYDMIEHFGLDENLPGDYRSDILVGFARAILKRSNDDLNVIDYDDMIYLPLLKNLKMLQHEWVLVDEAQDTNPTRRALAKRMMTPNGRLVAVGDPCQSIFGFTGADNDSLALITKEFDAVELPLTVTYRCPKAVVDVARTWVSHIEAHESAPDGEFSSMKYDDLLGVVKAGDAVLCRFNKYLVKTCFAAIRAGIPAKIEGRAIGQGLLQLANRWTVKSLDKLTDKLEEHRGKEIAKAMEKKNEAKVERINDQIDTLLVLINRARDEGHTKVADLKIMVEEMFADGVDGSKMVTLCSLHRSKGREWRTVYFLGMNELYPRVEQEWMHEQERNLLYVGATRAMNKLVNVIGVKEPEDRRYGN